MYIKADLYIKPKRMSTGDDGGFQKPFCFDSGYRQMLRAFDTHFGQFRQRSRDTHFHYTFTDREIDLSEFIRLLEEYREKAYIKLRFSRVYEEGEDGGEAFTPHFAKEFYCYEGKRDSASDFFGEGNFMPKALPAYEQRQAEEQDFLFKNCSFMKNPVLKKTVCASCSKRTLCTCACPGKKMHGGVCQRKASSPSSGKCPMEDGRVYVSKAETGIGEESSVRRDPYYGKKHILIRKLIFNLLSEYGPKSGTFETAGLIEEEALPERQWSEEK